MITHKIIDLSVKEKGNQTVMNGTHAECFDYITGEPLCMSFQLKPLTIEEMKFLNSYHNALQKGKRYLTTGSIRAFR